MAKEAFIEKRFNASSVKIIDQANAIITEYQGMGYTLTLRQLYYQFVARDLLPNKQSNYKRLGSIMSDARLAGLSDWAAIEDRTRGVEEQPAWDSPDSIISAVASQYQEKVWNDQPYRPEVWIEKEALVGVVIPVCEELRIPYFACRGYASQSAQYEASKRFARYRYRDSEPIILHLGDHDPSGIDMTRENRDKIELLCRGEGVKVERLALNMDQVRRYNPPPNPAKESDSRFRNYVRQYGKKSWELDALSPDVIGTLIRDAVEGLIDRDKWDAAMAAEERNKELLEKASDNWEAVSEFLADM